MSESLHLRVAGPVATITLRRPEAGNALDTELSDTLTRAFQKLSVVDSVRVVVLAAEGGTFCAGLDSARLDSAAAGGAAHAHRLGMEAAVLLDAVARCPKPVIALAQGDAEGLGVGLLAACDLRIAAESARFRLPEVRQGLAAAPSAPALAQAIGIGAARRLLLTGETLDARAALRLGLVHEVAPDGGLEAVRVHFVESCLRGGPKALAATKDLLRVVAESPSGPDLMRFTAGLFGDLALSDEGREGLAATAARRPPDWAG